VPRRVALALVLLSALSAPALRRVAEIPPARSPCTPEGRGVAPVHWLGCPADPGPARALADEERLSLGLPLDPNRAKERVLAHVPGLSRALAAEIVRDRAVNGRFHTLADLERVRGIGPRRLAQASPFLEVHPP
jgi:competence protein ComEA